MSAEITPDRVAASPTAHVSPSQQFGRRYEGIWRVATRLLHSRLVAFAALASAVVAYAGAWGRGALLIDGPGIAVYVSLALRHLETCGRVTYWLPEMWTGTPIWAIGPSFPVLLLVPLAAVVGSVTAVKVAILALQVAGAWGAYTLARSLWDHVPAALVAGLVYGLNPIVISHGALAGTESSMGVIAATPWLVWSLRRGLRGDGTRYLVVAGLVSAFAVLHEAELAYGVALLCACLVAMEVGRLRAGLSDVTGRRLVGRGALVVAICLGAIAHWLLPFLALHQAFVLSPRALVQGELLTGIGNTVGRELGIFLHRSTLHGVLTPERPGLVGQVLYLGRVPAAITVVTAAILARRKDDHTLAAILLSSAIGLWLSTGAASLAVGGPVARADVAAIALVGVLGGLVAGGFLRRLELGRATVPVGIAAAVFFFVAPYLSPFTVLQGVVPLLASIRFPRFYLPAVLGVTLGTAWPVVHVHRWLRNSSRPRPAVVAGAVVVAGAIAIAVLVDVWPYRSFYRLQKPPSAAAYRKVQAVLANRPPGSRVANGSLDPRIVRILSDAGVELSLGWPHPVASSQIWRLTIQPLLGPAGYGYRALGLSASALVIQEVPIREGTETQAVKEIKVLANPTNLPVVRTYDQAIVVEDESIAPELAVAMAHRNVGVVTGGGDARRSLGPLARPAPVPSPACTDPSVARLPDGLAGEVGVACALRPVLDGNFAAQRLFGADRAPGAMFTASSNGLRGMSVWFSGDAGDSELVLRRVAPDGSIGSEVARGKATGLDENGLVTFGFDPLVDSAGQRYAYDVTCPTCYAELEPEIVTLNAPDSAGNLLLNGRLDRDHLAAFTPDYDRPAPAQPTSARVSSRRPAPDRWDVTTSGPRSTLLVVAEAYFPGWRASVDGRRVPVLKADGAFIGVALGPGDHHVTLEYPTPTAAVGGRIVTAATLLALLLGGIGSRRRRRRRDALHVSTPPVEPGGQDVLDPGQGQPGRALPDGEAPGGEGDEAVLATGDDGHPGPLDHGQERGRSEP